LSLIIPSINLVLRGDGAGGTGNSDTISGADSPTALSQTGPGDSPRDRSGSRRCEDTRAGVACVARHPGESLEDVCGAEAGSGGAHSTVAGGDRGAAEP
jgi:hypothetical protein